MLYSKLARARRAALLGCASTTILAAAVAPSHAEQQVINFNVNGGSFYDVTGASSGSGTGCCYSYVGPGTSGSPGHTDHPHNTHPAITFSTTSSGNGAISEAGNQAGVGTKGHPVTGVRAGDTYDGYGGIGLVGQNNFGGLTVNRNTQVTHGPTNNITTPITTAFTNAGVPNAARWVETIINNTGSTITGTFGFFGNLGSDSNTLWVATNNGALTPSSPHSATGNLWLTSIQNTGAGPDPVNTHILGNNTYTKTQVLATNFNPNQTYTNGIDRTAWLYPISVAPGQTVRVVLFNVVTADLNFDPNNPGTDIALGGQLANQIINNGNPISINSPFFAGLTPAQLATIINYSFAGLTIDTSQAFFTENDFAAQQNPSTFDGGTLKPTTAFTFNQPFTVHSTGGTIDSSNGNLAFNGAFSGPGGLTFTGVNATTLAAASPSFTGAIMVNGGSLFVTGDLSSSSGLTVNSGGTLGGTGMVASTTVNAGGVLMPGPGGGTVGTLTVNGNLAFATAASYLVTINGAASALTNVTGTAALNGASVAVANNSQVVLGTKYTILTAAAGGLGGGNIFNPAINSGLFTGVLSYDPNDVFVTFSFSKLAPRLSPGAPTNMVNVANAIDIFSATTNTLPPGFQTLLNFTPQQLGQALNALSGEVGTGAKIPGFQLMNSFLSLLVDPFADGRPGGIGPLPFAPETAAFAPERATFTPEVAKAYASVLKAPPAAPAPAYGTFNGWVAAYGGTSSTRGNAIVGSSDVSAQAVGSAAGVDYRISADAVVGVALGGASTSWSLSTAPGSGSTDAFQAGVYGSRQLGPVYVSGVLAVANHWVTTTRTVAVAGRDVLNASFNALSLGGRAEGGYRLPYEAFVLTPYAAVQAQSFRTPSYTETAATGSAQFALAYTAQTSTDVRSELGSWASRTMPLAGERTLSLFGRAAWAHQWVSNNSLTPTFLGLPTASFVVGGAKPPSNLALLTTGAELKLANGWSVMARFEGELASGAQTYSGTGRVSYAW